MTDVVRHHVEYHTSSFRHGCHRRRTGYRLARAFNAGFSPTRRSLSPLSHFRARCARPRPTDANPPAVQRFPALAKSVLQPSTPQLLVTIRIRSRCRPCGFPSPTIQSGFGTYGRVGAIAESLLLGGLLDFRTASTRDAVTHLRSRRPRLLWVPPHSQVPRRSRALARSADACLATGVDGLRVRHTFRGCPRARGRSYRSFIAAPAFPTRQGGSGYPGTRFRVAQRLV